MDDRIAYWHAEERDGMTILVPIPADPFADMPTRVEVEDAFEAMRLMCDPTSGCCIPLPDQG